MFVLSVDLLIKPANTWKGFLAKAVRTSSRSSKSRAAASRRDRDPKDSTG